MIKIMICEDVRDVRDGFKYLLGLDADIKVVDAYPSAEELLKGIERLGPPDIILMDIVLPGMSGIEATALIKETYPHINVLMLTIFEEENKILNAIEAGATGYILKNTKPGELVNQIKEMHTGGSPISPHVARKLLEEIQKEKRLKPREEFHLTPREKEIMTSIAEGYTSKEIGDQYNIAHSTVKKHILHIYKKMNVKSKVEFMKKVITQDLLDV